MQTLDKANQKLVDMLVEHRVLSTERIIDAFRRVPRHLFVAEGSLELAYLDIALPTMLGSTISQPTTVAMMLELLGPVPGDRVLEIGTGSGWEAALLGHCVGKNGKVVSLDIKGELVEFAKQNLKKVGADNVEAINIDAADGYPKGAPYDKIIYAVAVLEVPETVRKQVRVGGTILAPIGRQIQALTVIKRLEKDKFAEQTIDYFQFVPMQGKRGIK